MPVGRGLYVQRNSKKELKFGRFLAREDHPNVPHKCSVNGIQLGHWVSNIKKRVRKDSDQYRRLDALPGWIW